MMTWLRRRRQRGYQRPFYVRRLDCPSDIEACVSIAARAGGETFTRDDLVFWQRDDATIIVAVAHDEVVGFVCHIVARTTVAIVHLAVDPDWQRRGIGRQLLLGACLYRPDRYRVPLVEVCETDAAVEFFRACGFTAIGTSRDYTVRDGLMRDAYIMRLALGSLDELQRSAVVRDLQPV